MIKCPYCGKEFEEQVQPKQKWYFSTYWFVIALLCVGPFALPLMWFNPRYKLITKVVVSVAVIGITIWFYSAVISAYHLAMQQLGGLKGEF
ncbi:MAG: hypothetical protein WCE45_08760 [Sedimentisphaerales bacterium]